MNAVYLCTIAQPWINVIKRLESESNINASYIVHWEGDKSAYVNSNLKNSYFQSLENAWKGLGFPKSIDRYIFDEEELKKISFFELIGLKMIDRLDPDGESFPFNSRLYFFRDLLGYWMNVVEDKDIDVVISPSIPHRVFDYALYVVCQIKNIKFLMFQMTPFGSQSLVIDDIDSMPHIDYKSCKGGIPSKDILDKINKVKKNYLEAIPEYMKVHAMNDKTSMIEIVKKLPRASYRLLFRKPKTYWINKGYLPEKSTYSSLQFQKMQTTRSHQVKAYEKLYQSLVTVESYNNFVLVALHYQPEETSCPTGGSYADQILMIQLLNSILPDSTTIVVKEHKSQFYTHQEGASGRDEAFYNRIANISPRIKFASVDEEPFGLIDKANAVITISGTIGWESAIRGTPVLVFGRAWYEAMPRVFKVKTKDDVKNALDQIASLNNKNLDNEILAFHAALEARLIRAKHYKTFLKNKDVNMIESEQNIINEISSQLNS